MAAWLDALFGRVYSAAVEVPLEGGLNFTKGLRAARNTDRGWIDVTIDVGGVLTVDEGDEGRVVYTDGATGAVSYAPAVRSSDGSYLGLGLGTLASAGTVRLPATGASVRRRNNDDDGDWNIIDAGGVLTVGDPSDVGTTIAGGVVLVDATVSGALRVGGVEVLSASSAKITIPEALAIDDGASIRFGLDPASMGEVRFSSAWSVVSKDGVSGLNQTHFASDGVTLFIGTQSSYPVKYASGTSHSFYTGGSAQVIIDTAGVSAQFVPLKVLGVGSYLAVDNYLSIGTGTLPSTGLLRLPDGGKIVHHDGTGNRDTIATDGTSVLVNDGLSVNTERVNAAILPLRIAEVWEYAPADSPKVKSRTLYAAATLTGEDAEVITLATTGGTAYAVPSGFLARIILEIYARDTSTGDAYLSLTTITGKRESGGVFVARGTPDPDANLDPDVPVTNGCTASVAFTSSNIVVTVESSSGTVEWTVVATIQETVL
jgi:hypothetical protein